MKWTVEFYDMNSWNTIKIWCLENMNLNLYSPNSIRTKSFLLIPWGRGGNGVRHPLQFDIAHLFSISSIKTSWNIICRITGGWCFRWKKCYERIRPKSNKCFLQGIKSKKMLHESVAKNREWNLKKCQNNFCTLTYI